MSSFTFEKDLEVRFRDLDPMGHVNNAVYGTYLEQTRAAYFDQVIEVPLPEAPTVIASLEIEYHSEITIRDAILVRSRITELGTSSIPIEYEIHKHPIEEDPASEEGLVLAATGETVQVTYDVEARESIPIPEEWRDRIAVYEGW